MAESGVVDRMLVVVGTANDRGIKPQGGSEYINWSQFGPIKEGSRPVPQRGATVKVGLDNKGFIIEMTDKDGNPLGGGRAGAAAAGGSVPFTVEDQRRITLLSCLNSAVLLYTGLGLPELKDGEENSPRRIVDIPLKTARYWAKQIDPDLFRKQENRNGQPGDQGDS